jgi:hypothetical protein
MTTEKHDPWALLREARETMHDFAENFDCDGDSHKYNTTCRACDAAKQRDRIDAAFAEHDTPVVESDESNAVWRAYANRELSEDEAKAKLAALEAKSAALAEHDTPVVESEVPWENSQQVTFLNGFRIQVYPSRLELGWWEFLVERDPRDPNERFIGQGTSKQAAMRGGIQAVKEWK